MDENAIWIKQLQNSINTLDKLKKIINVTAEEENAITNLNVKWGTTPYFASLMDVDDPRCPIRMQVIPSMKEQENKFGITNYLYWKENHDSTEKRPDCIGRHYKDRIAFVVTEVCSIYCRHCLRREITIDKCLDFKLNIEEGLQWIKEHKEIRDVVLTGGDPFILPDDKIEYIITKLREIKHVEMIRFGTRVPITLPQRITTNLRKFLSKYHKVPIWINTQCNHPKEITELTAKAVYDLLSCGISVGNQSVLLKGINDDSKTFKELHQKLLSIRVRPYYLYYCEPVPGVDHFRTPIEKGAELIRNTLRGHTTGMAQPMYVIATRIGKISLMPDYYFVNKTEKEYILKNHDGEVISIPVIE